MMKEIWHDRKISHVERFILAGDIGGTKASFGLVGVAKQELRLLFEVEIPSQSITDFVAVVKGFFERCIHETGGKRPDRCCIGANGPVKDQHCYTNGLPWNIDGQELQNALQIPTLLINDFNSVSYAIPLIDVNDPQKVAVLNRGVGPCGSVKAVIGAGTGLGVGLILQTPTGYSVLSSEGGNMDFSPFDSETEAFRNHFHGLLGETPSFELCCSGRGLKNLFSFALVRGWINEKDPVIEQIQRSDDIPRLISQHAMTHAGCRKIFDTFIKVYARFSSSIATVFLPSGGLYLAGGIGPKNLPLFLENDIFVETYKHSIHANPIIPKFLADIPVYMILNYNMALLGSANAALNVLG